MKLVLDTNVFISGIFFSGPPYGILQAWRAGKVQLVVCLEILAEYREVAISLSQKYQRSAQRLSGGQSRRDDRE